MDCEICAFAEQRNQWPILDGNLDIANPDGKIVDSAAIKITITHCRDCHTTWKSFAQVHCTVCHCQFATDTTADYHWIGEDKKRAGVHVHPSEVAALVCVEEQFGPVWRRAE